MKKRLLATIMSLAMVTSLTACGAPKETTEVAIAVEAPAEVPKTEAAPRTEVETESASEKTEAMVEEATSENEIIQWTNEEIKKEVINKLGKEDTDTVTVQEAASIEDYINISLYENFDTNDLKYLTNITELMVSGDKVEDISFVKELFNLKYLTFVSQNLTDLSPLVGNTSIENLMIQTYGLEDLSGLSGMTSLKRLEVYTDILSDVSTLGELHSLEECDINSNCLETIKGDFSSLSNFKHMIIYNDVLVDATALTTIPFILGTEQRIKLDSSVISDETLIALAEKSYEKWCLECKTNGKEQEYQNSYIYDNFVVNCSNYEVYEARIEQLIEEKGHPRDLIPVVTEKPQPVNTLQEEFVKPEFELDGQLICLTCSLQTLLDYGYEVADNTDLTDKLAPGMRKSLRLVKNGTIYLQVDVKNMDEKVAKTLNECNTYSIEYDASDIELEERPALYVVKCPCNHQERGECSESGYISWDSKYDCWGKALTNRYEGFYLFFSPEEGSISMRVSN